MPLLPKYDDIDMRIQYIQTVTDEMKKLIDANPKDLNIMKYATDRLASLDKNSKELRDEMNKALAS